MTVQRGVTTVAGLALMAALSSCGDSSKPVETRAPEPVVPKVADVPRFERATYAALDGKSVALVSPTELEFRRDGKTYSCQYTREGGRIRAVVEAAGTKTVEYFAESPDGLTADDGTRYYSPTGLELARIQARGEELKRHELELEAKIAAGRSAVAAAPNTFVRSEFTTMDAKSTIRLVSPTDMEIEENGKARGLRYVREQGRIRATIDPQKRIYEYFTETAEGLSTGGGTVYYQPAQREIAIARRQADDLRRQKQELEEKLARARADAQRPLPVPVPKTGPAPIPAQPRVADVIAVDYVLQAEECAGNNDRAGAIRFYDRAISLTENDGNPVQARIFAARRAAIERGKR